MSDMNRFLFSSSTKRFLYTDLIQKNNNLLTSLIANDYWDESNSDDTDLILCKYKLCSSVENSSNEKCDFPETPLQIDKCNTLNDTIGAENLPKKQYVLSYNVVTDLTDSNFKAHFRLSKTSVEELMKNFCAVTADKMKNSSPSLQQVMMTLWYLGSQESLNDVSSRFNMRPKAGFLVIAKVVEFICIDFAKYIEWPNSNTANEIHDGFRKLAGKMYFPGAFGAIGSCHIKIMGCDTLIMESLDLESLINNGIFDKIVLQGVCNAKGEFTSIYTSELQNSVDYVFKRSDIGLKLWMDPSAVLPADYHLIGDCCFPLMDNLMTTYEDNGILTPKQSYYNEILKSNSRAIDSAFGKLFARFRRLRFIDTLDKKCGASYILTCCILHNFCLKFGDDIAAEDFQKTSLSASKEFSFSAIQKRDKIADDLFANNSDTP